ASVRRRASPKAWRNWGTDGIITLLDWAKHFLKAHSGNEKMQYAGSPDQETPPPTHPRTIE
ncbi:MAG: hypothetical protein VST66_03180, partial [Nitrospirota bacterium]|nr:hypothetical protein [Nitrospirota bacterium]